MANEMAIQTSSFGDLKAQEDEECQENIPPPFTLSENYPVTSSSSQNDEGELQLSGRQSALTPFFKFCKIGNESISPKPMFLFNNSSPRKPNESVSVNLLDTNNPAYSVLNETLPKVSFLDVTWDSTMNMTQNTPYVGAASTPALTKNLKKPEQIFNVNLKSNRCSTITTLFWQDEILPEITLLDDTCDTSVDLTRHCSMNLDSAPGIPICEIPTKSAKTILDVNPNSTLSSTLTPKTGTGSFLSVKEALSLETTHDCTANKPPSEKSEVMVAKLEELSQEQMSNTFTVNLTHSINSCSGVSDGKEDDVTKAQLQVTHDISMSSTLDDSKSSENCTRNKDKSQAAVESKPVNIGQDLSASSDVQCEGSQSLESNAKNVTFELQVGHVKTSYPKEETSHNSDITTTGTNQSTAGSSNGTFTAGQEPSSALSHVSKLQNRTLALPTSNSGNPPMTENQKTTRNTKAGAEASLVLSDSCSDSMLSQRSEMQNQTFDKNPLHKPSASTILEQAGATTKCLQNTFESKPNGTINNTETSITSDKPEGCTQEKTSSQVNNITTETIPDMSGDKNQATTDPTVNPAEPPKSSFDVNQAVEENSGASGRRLEARDSLNNGQPFSNSIIHHITESHNANDFSLDISLDFTQSHNLLTSTPMPTSKAFNFTIETGGQTAAAQKKLYKKGASKPGVQGTLEIPSNIVCDRKSFLPQPATKQNFLDKKPPSLLSKFKPAYLLPKRPALLTSGLPTTGQVETLKNNAPVLQQTTEISSSYNLRSTAAESLGMKQPSSGIRKPSLSSIPSGIQRPGHGFKLPMPKSSATASTGSDKPAGGNNPLKSIQPGRKHTLPRTEALPVAKKKKMDMPLPSSNVDVPLSLLDTASKTKTLKPPTHSQRTLHARNKKHAPSTSKDPTDQPSSRVRTFKPAATGPTAPTVEPLCHGCENCSALEKQLKTKDEEIKLLKEELRKYSVKDPAE